MKTLKIYDPAMCCSSGVCGPDVDPELVRLATFLKSLDESAVTVERYNLSQEPGAYTANAAVASSGSYPELGDLSALLGASRTVNVDMPDCSGCSGCG